jgi:hypothetical protein
LAAVLPVLPAAAETLGDRPGAQELQANPPPEVTCNGPISVMSALDVGDEGATMIVTNTASVPTKDTLLFDLVVEGEHWIYGMEIKLASGASTLIDARFLRPVSSPVIVLCSNKPIGIIDCPDPVLGVTTEPVIEGEYQ